MRAQDIVVNETYRLRSSPNYGYVKAIVVLKPKEDKLYKNADGLWKTEKNPKPYIIVKCEHSVSKMTHLDSLGTLNPVI